LDFSFNIKNNKMKTMKKSIFIAILSLFTLNSVFGQSFTTTTISVSTDTICAGSSVTLQFTATNPTRMAAFGLNGRQWRKRPRQTGRTFGHYGDSVCR
jgi:hypothetical protein